MGVQAFNKCNIRFFRPSYSQFFRRHCRSKPYDQFNKLLSCRYTWLARSSTSSFNQISILIGKFNLHISYNNNTTPCPSDAGRGLRLFSFFNHSVRFTSLFWLMLCPVHLAFITNRLPTFKLFAFNTDPYQSLEPIFSHRSEPALDVTRSYRNLHEKVPFVNLSSTLESPFLWL